MSRLLLDIGRDGKFGIKVPLRPLSLSKNRNSSEKEQARVHGR
jgi:hypothetical protein